VDLHARIEVPFVVDESGAAYVVSKHGDLHRVDSNGELDWTLTVGKVDAGPAIAPGQTILIGTRRGELKRVAWDGTTVWTIELDSGVTGAPVVADGGDTVKRCGSG